MINRSAALQYHEASKHHFHRFARSLGYLDWATQPDPFRRYTGAPLVELPRPVAAPTVSYDALYEHAAAAAPIDARSVGTFLRFSLGLSAWKQHGASRWALRVNPSSGNLHPTEAYLLWRNRVYHYAPREHALEERCVVAEAPACPDSQEAFLVGLTSIHWREAWKYGERAFRYCQHDTGHAIGALRCAAAMLGWQMVLLPYWSTADVAAAVGVERDADFAGAEREEAECLAIVTRAPSAVVDPAPWVAAVRAGRWQGLANRLSADRVDWPAIDEVAAATRS